MTATKEITFTYPQRQVMLMLDGRIVELVLPRTYRRVLDNLAAMGMLTFRSRKMYGATQYLATLTREGSDFIYNGGLDH